MDTHEMEANTHANSTNAMTDTNYESFIAAKVPVEIAKRAQEPVKPAVWWSIDSTGRPCAWPVVAEAPRG
jgi:hypothetical protein